MLAIHHNHESLQLLRECYSCLNLQQQQQKLMLRSRPICSRNSNLPLILSHRSVPPLQVESVCPPPLLLLLAPSIPPPLLPQSPLLMSLYWLLHPDSIICCFCCCCCRSSYPRLSHRPRCHDRLCCCPCLCCPCH